MPETSDRPGLQRPLRGEWLAVRVPTAQVNRTTDPLFLSLEDAVAWVRRERPIVWAGSILSVPEPSGLPSGLALTEALLHMVFLELPDEERRTVVEHLASSGQFALELLLDEFERVTPGFSESLLAYFKDKDAAATPSALHRAVVDYYRQGLAIAPVCVTSNWDTLLERAFRDAGFKTRPVGPGWDKTAGASGEDAIIEVHHPHGSYELGDIVCSAKAEQRGVSLQLDHFSHPTMFLGYSGYEPSLYDYLLKSEPQLWCIRSLTDLKIATKRRLLCRPNVVVYVGDLCDLLKGLGVLGETVDTRSAQMPRKALPDEVRNAVRFLVAIRQSLDLCVFELAFNLSRFPLDRIGRWQRSALLRALNDHSRNAPGHPLVISSLLAATAVHNTEQAWISLLACLLRARKLEASEIDLLWRRARHAPRGKKRQYSRKDLLAFHPGVLAVRTEGYARFLGRPYPLTEIPAGLDAELRGGYGERWWLDGLHAFTLWAHDLPALGELMELYAWSKLADGSKDAASLFDFAADRYYLAGLGQAGQRCEWASQNWRLLAGDARTRDTLYVASTGMEDSEVAPG